jgi:hypothetical protein
MHYGFTRLAFFVPFLALRDESMHHHRVSAPDPGLFQDCSVRM